MAGDDLQRAMSKHPEARTWEEWRQLDHPQSKEPNQEPVQIAPIPAYEYPTTTPGTKRSNVPGVTPLPVQLIRDPERVTIPESSRHRENAPVSTSPHSLTPTRTRPLLPARREPEHSPTPVHPVAEIVQDTVQVSPQKRVQEPPVKEFRTTRLPEPEQAPQKFKEKFKSPEILPQISETKLEPETEQGLEHKPEVKPESTPEHSGQPTAPLLPKFTTKLYGKKQKRGRQRGKDRNDSTDGVRQLFELWWDKASRGVRFSHFYRNNLSEDMRFYYPREYINGKNAKSAAEYRQWRKEWTAKQAVKTA